MPMLNPNHPMSQMFADPEVWPSLVVLLLHKLDTKHLIVTAEDLEILRDSQFANIAIQELEDGLHLTLITREAAEILADLQGGLPQ